ncbi:MAG: KEOPS complex subunit Cgi121 [Candidatus Bathyarchaeia archaeon]
MLKLLQEFGKHIAIAGFRDVKIIDVETFLKEAKEATGENVEVQFFDARLVASWQHLYFAALNALKAFKNKENISKNLNVEIALYASKQRQIRKAMELLGVKQGIEEIAVTVICEDAEKAKSALDSVSKLTGGRRDDKVLELTKSKISDIQRFFGISEVEIEAVKNGKTVEKALIDLIIEKIALLAIES